MIPGLKYLSVRQTSPIHCRAGSPAGTHAKPKGLLFAPTTFLIGPETIKGLRSEIRFAGC